MPLNPKASCWCWPRSSSRWWAAPAAASATAAAKLGSALEARCASRRVFRRLRGQSQQRPARIRLEAGHPRILASNTKLFTTSAALARYGTDWHPRNRGPGRGSLDEEGIWRGNLYLRGGGDPTFGSGSFTRRSYRSGATVEQLAKALDLAGIKRVTGRVVGDESRFDSLRGGPDSGYGTSIWVGPLSALSFNRGLANEGGCIPVQPSGIRRRPARRGARGAGVTVRRKPVAGRTPDGLEVLASVESPPMARLVKLTNKPSDNFFAETLVKDLALQARGRGTTAGGARIAAAFARRGAPGEAGGRLGALARQPRLAVQGGAPAQRVDPERRVRRLPGVAPDRRQRRHALRPHAAGGRSPPLPRQDRHASNVSALSGYCRARSGRHLRLLDPDERRVSGERPGRSRTGWRRRSRRWIARGRRAASVAPRSSASRRASSSRSPRASRPSFSTVISAFLPFALTRHRPARRPSVSTDPGAGHGPEQALAQVGLRREQHPVRFLQVGVAGRNQADALGGGRRLERVHVLAHQPSPALPDPHLGQNKPSVSAHRRPAWDFASPAPLGEVAGPGRTMETEEAAHGFARGRRAPRLDHPVAALGVQPRAPFTVGGSAQHRCDVMALAALATTGIRSWPTRPRQLLVQLVLVERCAPGKRISGGSGHLGRAPRSGRTPSRPPAA